MTRKIDVRLVYCPTCPILPDTREALKEAIENFGREKIQYKETNVHAPENPPDLKHWPSPTVLINGRDIEGIVQNPDQPCRLFQGDKNKPGKKQLHTAFEEAFGFGNQKGHGCCE